MIIQCGLSTVCDDLLVIFEDVWSERVVVDRLLSTVCDDVFFCFRGCLFKKTGFATSSEHGVSKVCGDLLGAFGDVWSKRMVLHCLLSTVSDDLLVAFEQA